PWGDVEAGRAERILEDGADDLLDAWTGVGGPPSAIDHLGIGERTRGTHSRGVDDHRRHGATPCFRVSSSDGGRGGSQRCGTARPREGFRRSAPFVRRLVGPGFYALAARANIFFLLTPGFLFGSQPLAISSFRW